MMFENYRILEQRHISDLNSEGYILEHIKTKAVVTLLLNDDENKVFYIGFRTPPKDSTGVAHILEHSVLCGSRKFPVKDPFIELAKGSLNTFLNAMTYPDKTVYPVASCNNQDFHNLVDVYLDAVFHPNIYKNEKIFRQEGWHYELESRDDELTLNGVVYNEMKGVYSSPDDVVESKVMMSLYPDTTYGLESGGDPEVIPSLTYEDFLAFHAKYYHPSNCYIYLYGDMDAAEYLKFIDEEYLSEYEYLEVDSAISLQAPFEEAKTMEMDYPVLDESEDDGSYLTYNVSMGTSLDRKLYAAIDILDYALCSAPGAQIKQALIDAGIGEDVYSCVEGGIYQPFFAIIAKNANKDDKDRFVNIIEEKLKEMVKEGLPKKSLLAAINHFEFRYREADYGSYPKGLMLGLQAFDSWLYDRMTPFWHIEANETYKFLKDSIDSGYFEELLDKYILSNQHKTIIAFNPKAGLTTSKDEILKKKLEEYKNSLSVEEIEKIVSGTVELKEYQSEPSPKEDLAKIPMLKKSDLKKEAVGLVNRMNKVGETSLLYHDIFTNGIGYLQLMFKLDDVPKELFPYISVMKLVIGMMDTKNYSYGDLFDEINIRTGGLGFDVSTYNDFANRTYNSYLCVKTKFLYENLDEMMELVEEVIIRTKLDDSKRLLEILNEAKARSQAMLMSSGHTVALSRVAGYIMPYAKANEALYGLDSYRFLEKLLNDYDNNSQDIIDKIKQLFTCIFRPENLFADYTCESDAYKDIEKAIEKIKKILYTEPYEKDAYIPIPQKENEGFYTAGQVQYVCVGGDYIAKGLKYTGALRVLKTMMSYDYLWNNVRVLGGAYGCMNGFGRSGLAYFVSYRDPNLKNTLEVYDKASEYIKNIELDESQVLKYIIGTLSDLDTPMTPASRASHSMTCYFGKISDADIQKERDEILNVTEEDIRGLYKYIDAIVDDKNICVVGNVDIINESKDIFNKLEQLC